MGEGAETYEVLALKYGHMERSSRDFYLHHPDPHEGPRAITYYLWVVRNANRTVVVDLGFDRRSGDARGRIMLREPLDALAAIGVDPAEVETVIITHMHYDHAGHTPRFPKASFVLQEREIAYCTGKPMSYAPLRRSFDVEHVTDVIHANFQSRVKFVDGDREILPGISVHLVGGHSGGLQVVRVMTQSGPLVIASDAAHFYDTVTEQNPFTIIVNLPEMCAGWERIFELGAEPGLVIPGHDPLVAELYPRHHDDDMCFVLSDGPTAQTPWQAWKAGG
ncbi:MAG: N-acyl homoserine lactonase family protein [Methyloligellaceae bacterium]